MAGARLRGHGLGLGGAERQAAGPAEPARIRRNLSFSSGLQVSRLAPFWKAPGIRGGARTLEACQGGYSLPRCPDGSGKKMAASQPPRYSRALESADGHAGGESSSCHPLARCRNHGNPFSGNSTGGNCGDPSGLHARICGQANLPKAESEGLAKVKIALYWLGVQDSFGASATFNSPD